MDLEVRGRKLRLSKAIETYVTKKMSKLDHLLPSIKETKVEISKEKSKSPINRYAVQITVKSDGMLIRAEERHANIYAAIDAADDVIRRQISRYKGKFYLKNRRVARRKREIQALAEPMTLEEEHAKPSDIIYKKKRFPIKVMTVAEAVEQMELLGHDFFIFVNDGTNSFSVLYRRKDGKYGLIEPEIV